MENPDWTEAYKKQRDEDGYVYFNEDRRLGQNQYASRMAEGKHGSPNLGQGLRWKNLDSGNYHSLMIHEDDLVEFHRRVIAYKADMMVGQAKEAEYYINNNG